MRYMVVKVLAYNTSSLDKEDDEGPDYLNIRQGAAWFFDTRAKAEAWIYLHSEESFSYLIYSFQISRPIEMEN